MMFASKTPRDLNHDPEPFLGWDSYVGGELRNSEPFGYAERDPRPEFDHVQHNQPNPILVDFRTIAREDWGEPDDLTEYASAWLELVDEDPLMTEPANWGRLAGQATSGHIAHARRVLSRLARLGES